MLDALDLDDFRADSDSERENNSHQNSDLDLDEFDFFKFWPLFDLGMDSDEGSEFGSPVRIRMDVVHLYFDC